MAESSGTRPLILAPGTVTRRWGESPPPAGVDELPALAEHIGELRTQAETLRSKGPCGKWSSHLGSSRMSAYSCSRTANSGG